MRVFDDCTFQPLQKQVFSEGHFVGEKPSVREIAAFVKKQLSEDIWEEEQRFENPHRHYLDMTKEYYAMKTKLLAEMRG